MDSRIKTLAFQSLQRKSQMGRKTTEAGSHMYHAATGVLDGGENGGRGKSSKLKKAFARYRGYKGKDEGTHNYSADVSRQEHEHK